MESSLAGHTSPVVEKRCALVLLAEASVVSETAMALVAEEVEILADSQATLNISELVVEVIWRGRLYEVSIHGVEFVLAP